MSLICKSSLLRFEQSLSYLSNPFTNEKIFKKAILLVIVSIFYIGLDCSTFSWWILVVIVLAAIILVGIIYRCIIINRKGYRKYNPKDFESQSQDRNRFIIVAIAAKSYFRLSGLAKHSKEYTLLENNIV